MPDILQRQLLCWDLDVGSGMRGALLRYARLLSEYDRANVVGSRDLDEIVRRHVLDSLSCLLFARLGDADRLADVGSGGGLPGIPLAIVLPGVEVTLFESVGKKVAFLRYAIEELGLANARVVNGRVEEAGRQGDHRGAYDLCTVRAVARLSVLAEYCLPLLRVGGHAVAMKGRKDEEEWNEAERALEVLGGHVSQEIRVPELPERGERERRLVLLEKVARTPRAYPRRTGVPAQKPLGTR